MGADREPSPVASLPILVYDGDCGFCTISVEWARRNLGARPVAWQTLDLDALGLTVEDVTFFAWYVDSDGTRHAGAQAAARALRNAPAGGLGLLWHAVGSVLSWWPVRPVAAAVYRLVARNRHRLPGATDACALPTPPERG